MTTQNCPCSGIPEALLYGGRTGTDQPTIGDCLDEILIVVARCAVTCQNAMLSLRRGPQRPKPVAMVLVESRMGISVRCAHACRIRSRCPSIVVATNSQVHPPHQEIADLARPKWTGDAIAKVNRAIDATTFDVGKDGFERRQVSMD